MKAFFAGVIVAILVAAGTGYTLTVLNPSTAEMFYSEDTHSLKE